MCLKRTPGDIPATMYGTELKVGKEDGEVVPQTQAAKLHLHTPDREERLCGKPLGPRKPILQNPLTDAPLHLAECRRGALSLAEVSSPRRESSYNIMMGRKGRALALSLAGCE